METLLLLVGGLSFAAGIWVGQQGRASDALRCEEIEWSGCVTLTERTADRRRAESVGESAGDAHADYHLRLP